MKSFFTIILISVCVLQSSLSFLIYRSGRRILFEKRFERRADRRISRFEFPEGKDIKWEKPGKEFEYGAEIYDVLEIYDSASITVVNAFRDKKEEKFRDCFNAGDRSGRKSDAPLFVKVQQIKSLEPQNVNEEPPYKAHTDPINVYRCRPLLNGDDLPEFPPPEQSV